ncbi:MAG: hypothetical protein ACLRZG_00385 [Streptococcus sp.]
MQKLNKAVEEDPELKTTIAKRKIAKFIELSDENINQKVEIIMDHFIRCRVLWLGARVDMGRQ